MRPWVHKPVAAILSSYQQVKDQYLVMERTLEEISQELDVEPRLILEHIRKLQKAQDVTNLQARVDCLLKENRELRTQVEEGETQCQEL